MSRSTKDQGVETVDYLLCNTPLTDPTAPYHSISYLVGAAERSGYLGHRCVDLNLEMLDSAAQPGQMTGLLDDCAAVRKRIESLAQPTRSDELLYRHAVQAIGFTETTACAAIDVLRSPDRFYDPRLYRQAMLALSRWLAILSVRGLPGQFEGFALAQGMYLNTSSLRDLSDTALLDRLVAPFAAYLRGDFRNLLAERPWGLVGLSVNYESQLPFAAWLCREIRRRCPETLICIGGTEIAADLKFLDDPLRIWQVFPDCDALVVGEGEGVLVSILDSLSRGARPTSQPGLLLPEDSTLPAIRNEDLSELASPNYEIWDWPKYWSPEPVALYSPTRGCYWNRCTFCDYGLNTALPTSPSRERPVEAALEDLGNLRRHARVAYFAVDAISPSYLRRLASRLTEANLGLSWSAELRLEKSLSQEALADELRASGCIAIAFGFESGAQRILDLLAKGVDLRQVPALLAELHRVGIGAQMMGFVGFPGETEAEALATFSFLANQREHWTLAAIGDFGLTPGAIVAQRPRDFGIAETLPAPGDDIRRTLNWQTPDRRVHEFPEPRTARVKQAAATCRKIPAVLRPFAGTIDSPHTLLYFKRYGAGLLPDPIDSEANESLVETANYRTPFQDFEDFTTCRDLGEWISDRRHNGLASTAKEVSTYLGESRSDRTTGPSTRLEIYPSGTTLTTSVASGSAAYEELKLRLLETEGAFQGPPSRPTVARNSPDR